MPHFIRLKKEYEEQFQDLREKLAALSHEQWSGWARWMIDNWSDEFVERWERQIATPYSELSESEKDSDRKEADKILDLLMLNLLEE